MQWSTAKILAWSVYPGRPGRDGWRDILTTLFASLAMRSHLHVRWTTLLVLPMPWYARQCFINYGGRRRPPGRVLMNCLSWLQRTGLRYGQRVAWCGTVGKWRFRGATRKATAN